MHSFLTTIFNVLIVVASLFLIALVLIQRGKGGGLAGAFGGAGGSSAFGTKAGDVFTKITMITAGVWILMLMILVRISNSNAPVWVDDTPPGGARVAPGSTDKGGSIPPLGGPEIVPPVPTPSGPGGSNPSSALPAPFPDVSGAGPSAPLPATPLPTPATAPTTPPSGTAGTPPGPAQPTAPPPAAPKS